MTTIGRKLGFVCSPRANGGHRLLSVTAAVIGAVVLAGCGSKPDAATESHDSEEVSLFAKGKGVLFTDETRRLFGVEIVEVTEKSLAQTLHRTALVYRAGTEHRTAAASLWLPMEEARALKPGEPVKLKAGKAGVGEFSGRMVGLDAQAEAVTGQVEVLLEFADPAGRCQAGESLAATFPLGAPKPALVIPELALLTAADGTYVYAVNGTHLTRTAVKPGMRVDGWIEIEDGLYAGDSVAARGVENLWLVELSALKGGTPCCVVPKKAGK